MIYKMLTFLVTLAYLIAYVESRTHMYVKNGKIYD